ncbi:flagellar basal body P-ring formation chaperone FlgA [Paraburkholderia sp. J12]|uniref:flagellar basal body P-ring formation chaperone FlgA n=1 Tax=Paraburkholderia sp. J12 TaxID=2805432 RepID=UPI002ABE5958|nr:flagellar basal body P-ring formation chaperone FlgA [Paraburkholderia sp. J12]
MPQTAPTRARRAGMDRRSRGGAFLARLSGVALCCGLAAAGGVRAQSAQPTQSSDSQIYIPGPGDRAGSDAVRMSAMLAAPGSAPAAATAPNYAALSRLPNGASSTGSDSAPGGMITIPGPGERGSAPQADAPQIVTIPAPGTTATAASVPGVATPSAARNGANALPRVNVATASSRVAPVVVEASGPEAQAGYAAANARANAIQRYAAAVASTNPNANTAAAAKQNVAAPPNTAMAPATAAAQPVPAGQQDGESIRAAALSFLQQQSVGLPGKVTVTVAPVFPRGLAACTSLDPFMPPGARSWGRTTVGVRCVGAKPWTLYVAARVAVDVTYYVAGRQIEPGQTLSMADLTPREADLASLPRTVITDPSQAAGALALLRISAGLPLRTDMLRSAASVTIGQTVKVVAVGTNFTISSEGSVLNNAAPGEQVRVRTSGGQIITGVVKDAGTVQIQI